MVCACVHTCLCVVCVGVRVFAYLVCMWYVELMRKVFSRQACPLQAYLLFIVMREDLHWC